MMFRQIYFILLFSFGVLTSAHADNRQVWRNTTGNVVRAAISGTCVRQNSSASDPCAPPVPAASAVRTQIAKDERTVYFDFNKATLRPEAKAKLDALAEKLKVASDIEGVAIAGYADRIGSVSYNDALSKKRASVVRDYLVSRKVVNANVVKTRWFGKTEPSAQCPSEMKRRELIECLQPDRKVQVDIVYRVEAKPPAAEEEEPE